MMTSVSRINPSPPAPLRRDELRRAARQGADELTHLRGARARSRRAGGAGASLRCRPVRWRPRPSTQRRCEPRRPTQIFSHLHYVVDLGGAGEEHEIRLATGPALDSGAQRAGVHRQSPAIHRHAQDGGGALFQAGHELGVGDAVLLQGDAFPRQRQLGIEPGEQLAPGVRLRGRELRPEPHLAQRRHRLRPAADQRHRGQQGGEALAPAHALEQGGEAARTHPREQDHDVDLTRLEAAQELQGGRVVLQGHLPHRWRHQRTASVAPDQLRHLGCAPALEGKHCQPCQRCLAHAGTITQIRPRGK